MREARRMLFIYFTRRGAEEGYSDSSGSAAGRSRGIGLSRWTSVVHAYYLPRCVHFALFCASWLAGEDKL